MFAALALAAVLIQPGQTLSGIAAAHGVTVSALEQANPQITNPDLIYAGRRITIPEGHGPWSRTASSSAASSSSVPSSFTAPGGISVPGMPQSLADCIWYRESTDGTNPAADGNQFGIIPASGYDVTGESVAQQEQVAGELYAAYGGTPWAADGCPGT